MRVYVASPFPNALFIREIVHPRLERIGITPTSRWVEHASGSEDFSRFTPASLRAAATRNDDALRSSDAVLLVDLDGAGRETYGEVRLALEWLKPVVWLGRLTLSAFRPCVTRVEGLDDAMRVLADMREKHAEGYRGQLLAHLCGATS